jgi:hypothetical protein
MSRREIKRQTEGVRRIRKERQTDKQTMEKEGGKWGRKDKYLNGEKEKRKRDKHRHRWQRKRGNKRKRERYRERERERRRKGKTESWRDGEVNSNRERVKKA